MALLGTFANTLKIPELRKRILFTIGLVFVTRMVALIPTPGIDFNLLNQVTEAMRNSAAEGGLMNWFDMFTGGALSNWSVGTLGIWPYISASIIIQLMTAVIPSLERLSREGDAGRTKLTQITRYLTICIVVVQSFALSKAFENPQLMFGGFGDAAIVVNPGWGFRIMTVISMTSASMFIMWLADQITARGIGNGTSFIIMANITSRLPMAIYQAAQRYFGLGGIEATDSVFELIVLLILGFAVVMGTVMLTQGVRKVPIHSTRRMAGGRTFGGGATYMPLRVNFTGVMPIIFAGPLLQFPAAGLKWVGNAVPALSWCATIGNVLSKTVGPIYLVLYTLLILFFSFFWVATQFNAMNISDNLKRDGSYIPGIRPGRATAEYLDMVMTRVTLIGAIGLVIIAILPQLLMGAIHLPYDMASFFGGTSLLIIVGVALDTLRQMESHLLMRNYDGFLKHGKLRGRR